jgi:hypothetical protein
MKHEWRKIEKSTYLPKSKPEVIKVPEYNFITINGEGNPNNESFGDYIAALYAIAYTIKMTLKKEGSVKDYCDYTVYPLEGVWDINEKAKKEYDGILNKDDLIFKLMIRQPDFVTKSIFDKMKIIAVSKKKIPLLAEVQFEKITDGKCVQIMHLGSYDNEPASFAKMEAFTIANNMKRTSKTHREIYLSDFRKVDVEKLKTVLRFKVK